MVDTILVTIRSRIIFNYFLIVIFFEIPSKFGNTVTVGYGTATIGCVSASMGHSFIKKISIFKFYKDMKLRSKTGV